MASSQPFEIAKDVRYSTTLHQPLQPQQLYGQPAQLCRPFKHADVTVDWVHVITFDYKVRETSILLFMTFIRIIMSRQ